MKRIAVDIGGTFTDIIYFDQDKMEITLGKTRSTPQNPSHGVIRAIEKIKVDISETTELIHGATMGLNAILQRKGAKVGLITTQGFTDILEMARGDRKELYNFLWKKPKPLVPRYLRLGVSERTSSSGQVIRGLNEEEVKEIVKRFIENNVEAIAISLLNSYVNPENELMLMEMVKEIWPDVTISISHKVAREFREYERTSTTVLDAYIKKTTTTYFDQLASNIKDKGFSGQLLMVGSNGILGIDMAMENPLHTTASGPVGGVCGAARLAKLLDIKDMLTIDVGGTSFDVSIIKDGMNIEKHESELLGYPVLIPSIDVRSIGAGGGSIARVDAGGLLAVGPDSAGAEPGPMCYGLGGIEPTVTDAALINGLIDANYFIGGEFQLDLDLAKRGIDDLANKLKLSLNEAADGILRIARDNMKSAVEQILLGQGYDPRDFTAVSYGGAGGLFATGIARDMSIPRIVVPPSPGVFSAWGMLSMDLVHTYSRTYNRSMSDINIIEINNIYKEMKNIAIDVLKTENVFEADMEITMFIDMCYEGQSRYIEVLLPNKELEEKSIAKIINSFHSLHEMKYSYRMEAPIRTINLRLRAIGKIEPIPLTEIKHNIEIPWNAIKTQRNVYIDGNYIECNIYERSVLLSGNIINGPAIIEEPFHTTVVMSGQLLTVDKFGNLMIETRGA